MNTHAERDENTEREPFSPAEQVAHSRRIETRERELAKQRQREAGREHGRGIAGADSAPAIEPAYRRKSRTKIAKAVGTSHDTLSKARHVLDLAEDPNTPPEVAEVARLQHEIGELIAEMEEARTDPTRELVDAFGQRVAAIRAGLDAIEATS